MNRTLQVLIALAALVVIAICLALNSQVRISRARQFGEPQQVTTFGGTNYVVELSETTIGRTDAGHVLIVYLKIQNPNEEDLRLDRNWFVLLGPQREYFLPTTSGTQQQWITMQPGAVRDDVMLSFDLGPEALQGGLALKIGEDYWVLLKQAKPYTEPIDVGQFRSFKHNRW